MIYRALAEESLKAPISGIGAPTRMVLGLSSHPLTQNGQQRRRQRPRQQIRSICINRAEFTEDDSRSAKTRSWSMKAAKDNNSKLP